MKRPLLSDQGDREYHCPEAMGFRDGIMLSPLTFCGTLEEFYTVISRGWNNETKVKYDRDYNNVIFPNIRDHNFKIISAYTKEDCEQILNSIQEEGYLYKGERKDYSDSQMNHFKYLIYLVFRCATAAGLCNDFLWGTKFEINEEREKLAIRSKTQIKKSLNVEQEKKLFERLTETPEEEGELVALLLMFSLGLRDGEACGLDFGDIYELPAYNGCYVAVIKQSTIPNTSILQSSGKTWNSGRRIPIPSKVCEFLLERKHMILDIISQKGLDVDIDRLPVASKGYIDCDLRNFEIRLKADQVTETAREIFKQVEISSEVLSSLEIEMEEEIQRLEVTESNVTAYLLRRNFATHLKILGLDYSDIQYLLGHCIEDPYINRPDYTDSKLYILSKKMENRPLVNFPAENQFSLKQNTEQVLSGNKIINIKGNGNTVKVQINALEKNDTLSIKMLSKGKNVTVDLYEDYKSYDLNRDLDILKKYMGDYK